MSISSEITRIATNVANAKTAIGEKYVTVPQDATSDDLASLILQIKAVREDIIMIHISMDGSTGTSDMGFDEIYQAVFGQDAFLGSFVIGETALAGTHTGKYAYSCVQTEDDESLYRTNIFTGQLIALDVPNKHALFAITPTTTLCVDENRNVTVL